MTTPPPSSGPEDESSDRIRIGDRERESAMQALGQHMSEGRLTMTEYDERATAVAAAMTSSEVRKLFVDLPAPHPVLDGSTGTVALRRPAPLAGQRATAGPVARNDDRSRAQRVVGVAVGVSAVASVGLFFLLGTWLVFLIPVIISVAAGSWWGDNWKGSR